MDVTFVKLRRQDLDELPIVDGQIIFCKDTDEVWYDLNWTRHSATGVTLNTPQEITSYKTFTKTVTFNSLQSSGSVAGVDHNVAQGINTSSQGSGCHAEGVSTVADDGVGCHAEGSESVAQNSFSHAEGVNTRTLGVGAHSEGDQSIAEGDYSHSQGVQTHAIGEGSFASGFNSTASGDHSTSIGVGTDAGDDQTALGKYNAPMSADDVLAVGCGTQSTPATGLKVSGIGDDSYVTTNQDRISKCNYAEQIYPWASPLTTDINTIGRFLSVSSEEIVLADSSSNVIGVCLESPAVVSGATLGSYTVAPYVGLLGVMTVIDDGTCTVGQYCMCSSTGGATAVSGIPNQQWLVVARIDSTHVRILYT